MAKKKNHNGAKDGHSMKLLHKESMKFQSTVGLESGAAFPY